MSHKRILQQPYILNNKNTETEEGHRLDYPFSDTWVIPTTLQNRGLLNIWYP
jgi:hypothetical protein